MSNDDRIETPLPDPREPGKSRNPDVAEDSESATEVRKLRIEITELRLAVEALTRALAKPQQRGITWLPVRRIRPTLDGLVDAFAKRRRSWLDQGSARTEWLPPRPQIWTVVSAVLLTVVAFAIRAIDLSETPPGLHGDEAATGLEAHRILEDGSIGVYTGVAGGNPTGAYYLATIPIRLIDDPVVAVRMLSAVSGTLAVLILFLLARRQFGLPTAVIASTILTFSEWHIAFSRTGFVTGTWPTVVLIGIVALMEAFRTRASYWWVLAGGLLAAGTYIYNGNGPILLLVTGFATWVLFGWTVLVILACGAFMALDPSIQSIALLAASLLILFGRRYRSRRSWLNIVFFLAGAGIVLRPLLNFIRYHRTDYFGRGEKLSVFKTDSWRSQDSLTDKGAFLLDRYRDFWTRVSFDPIPDHVDLTGVTAPIPTLTLAFCLVGMVVALIRRPSTLVIFSTLMVALAPLTAVLTDLTLRRALVIAPFLALLGGVGAVEGIRLIVQKRGRLWGAIAAAIVVGLLAQSNYTNYTDLFDKTVHSGSVRHTFAVDLRDTAIYLDSLPPESYVYFYSERWVIEYDVVRLLAPDVRGENRMPKWGGDGSFTMSADNGNPVFVLLGPQMENLGILQQMYPGGEVITGPTYEAPINGPAFVAYLPPAPPDGT